MNNENDKSPQQDEKKVFTYQDLIKFSNTEIYSAFGEVKGFHQTHRTQVLFWNFHQRCRNPKSSYRRKWP